MVILPDSVVFLSFDEQHDKSMSQYRKSPPVPIHVLHRPDDIFATGS